MALTTTDATPAMFLTEPIFQQERYDITMEIRKVDR